MKAAKLNLKCSGIRAILDINRLKTLLLETGLITLHRRAVQPKFLLVEIDKILGVTEKQAVLNQYDPRRLPL